MLVKFLAHGTGSAQAAADYLTRELDSQGEVREDVAVLRGDPDAVAAVADTLEFEHKYTSGVIAWAPEDRPSDLEIDRVLDEFEQTAWAGLEPDRYAWAAVQHRAATGGVHVHVLAARCDLETGKSLNIAPPGWEQTYGPLVEALNLDQGWSRRMTRRAPGISSRGIAPISTRRSCGRGSHARTTRARRSGTTYGSASSTARCRTGRASSPPTRGGTRRAAAG